MRTADILLERLPLVSYMLDGDEPHAAVYVSPQVESFGLTQDDFAADDNVWTNRIVPDDRKRFREALGALQEDGDRMAVEYRVLRDDGRAVWVRDIAAYDDGTICGYLVDITREKELEHELAVERATLDAFFTQSSVALGITDSEGRYVRLNQALAAVNSLGSPGELLGRTLAEVSPQLAAIADPMRVGVDEPREFAVDVGETHVLASYFPFTVDGEQYHGRVIVDLTAQRRAEEAERHFRSLLERLPLVVYVNRMEPRHAVRYISPRVEELTGYTPEDFLADTELGDKIVHPDDFPEIVEREEASPDVFEHEYRIVRRDGEIRWVLDRMETIRDADGKALYEQGFLVDVTDSHETAVLLRGVWDAALDAMVIVDSDGRYVDANPAACRLFGRSRDEMVQLHVDDVFPRGTWAAYEATGSVRNEYALICPDGQERIVESAAKADVLPGLHFAALRDVTERRRLQSEVWRAQKLESVARLAGGVAHDFNNLLTAIRGYAQLLQARVAPGGVESHHALEIDRAADRAAALTAQLLALGRRQTLKARPLDLNRQLEDARDSLVDLAGVRTELVLELDPELHAVRADGPLLVQAIANLVENAAEAMPEGGTIAVRTRNEDVRSRDDLPDGRYVVVSVEDSGCGLDGPTLEHVFEPFFTTKEVGAGSGLGLASAYGTVRQSGGTIAVESELGVGTTFSIYLPEAAPDTAAHGGAGETVLVVERDPAVRDVVFEVLTDASYRVLTARTTADAVRIADRVDGPIDLLLTDLDELREGALVALLREKRPQLAPVELPKPYTPERLQRAVRLALGSPKRVTPAWESA
jgi:PAS domain S-box-containing protein